MGWYLNASRIRFASFLTAACWLLATGCGTQQKPAEAPAAASAPKIDSLQPNYTSRKTPFNLQPDGQSALAVSGKNIPAGSILLWNGQPLKTSVGATFVAASVPANFYETPGTVSITLKAGDSGQISNALTFTVYPTTGPAPQISNAYPAGTEPGKAFNVQPDGHSAFSVSGNGFLPGAALFFNGRKLPTAFGDATGVSGAVPAESFASAGSYPVWVVNPDGKQSNKLIFKVAK